MINKFNLDTETYDLKVRTDKDGREMSVLFSTFHSTEGGIDVGDYIEMGLN